MKLQDYGRAGAFFKVLDFDSKGYYGVFDEILKTLNENMNSYLWVCAKKNKEIRKELAEMIWEDCYDERFDDVAIDDILDYMNIFEDEEPDFNVDTLINYMAYQMSNQFPSFAEEYREVTRDEIEEEREDMERDYWSVQGAFDRVGKYNAF